LSVIAANSSSSATAVAFGGVPAMTFDELLSCHQSEIFRYAMQLTRDRHDAEDLFQETLIKAYRAFGRLTGEANYRAWLYRIATNTFLSGRRKASREQALDDSEAAAIPAHSVDEAGRLDARDLLSDVDRFIARLPEKQRAALVLRKYHEMEYAEIATALKCSEAAARANVHEALRKLKDHFADRL
jgi:RNA polymerase sigma-70 factor (ECF subfamily)